MARGHDEEGGLLRILASPVAVLLAISALVMLIRLLGSLSSAPRFQNVEVIEWVDWKGRVRRIVIRRKVE